MLNFYLDDIAMIVNTCIIIHNMTINCRRQRFIFNDAMSDIDSDDGDSDRDEIRL